MTEQELSDSQLLSLFHEPKADLSLLTPGEQSRLVKLTAETQQTSTAKPSAPSPSPPSTRGILRNAVGDTIDTLGGIPDAVSQIVQHPIDSVTAIPVGMIRRLVAIAKDPLGSAYEHPVNTGLDIAGVGSGVRAIGGAMEAPGMIRAARLMKRVDPNMANKSGYVAGPIAEAPGEFRAHAPATLSDKAATAQVADAMPPLRGPHVMSPVSVDPRAPFAAPENISGWHAYESDEARSMADPTERARIAGLHRDTATMDARYRQLIDDPRGSAPLGLLLHMPSALKSGGKLALEELLKRLPQAAAGGRIGMDAALATRMGRPQTQGPPAAFRTALLAALGQGSQ